MTLRHPSPAGLSWFGLLGAPFAWAFQHVAGYALTEATCDPVNRGGGLHLDAWTIVVTGTALAVGLASVGAAVAAWRRTSAEVKEPPESRVHFVAVMGMAFSPLFVVIMLMSGLGAVLLPECVQS